MIFKVQFYLIDCAKTAISELYIVFYTCSSDCFRTSKNGKREERKNFSKLYETDQIELHALQNKIQS